MKGSSPDVLEALEELHRAGCHVRLRSCRMPAMPRGFSVGIWKGAELLAVGIGVEMERAAADAVRRYHQVRGRAA